MDKPPVAKKMARRGWLVRGESAIASTGLALASVLLAAMGASAWWTLYTQRSVVEAARISQVKAIGSLLTETIERLLTLNELSAARRLIVDAARIYELQDCRIVLEGNGALANAVIADAEPSRITVHQLPETWANLPSVEEQGAGGAAFESADPAIAKNGLCTVRRTFEVPGRGGVTLAFSANVSSPPLTFWSAQAGLGVIGAAGLCGLLLIYRKMRSRWKAMGAIREALLAMHSGESSTEALCVYAEGCPESLMWNELLADRDRLSKQLLAERIHDEAGSSRNPAGNRRTGSHDLESVCDAMWQGLLLVDDRLQVKYANGAAAILLRGKREEIMGAPVASTVLDAKVLEAVGNIVNGTLKRRVTIEVQVQDRIREPLVKGQEEGESGRRSREHSSVGVLRFGVRPVRRGDAAAAMIIIEDITQQRMAEEARNTFVAQATHELRMPLTNIRLYAENALDEGENDPLVRSKCLNIINQESRRLERIVGDMLSVSEIEAGTLKLRTGEVRLDSLFEEVRGDYTALAAEKHIKLSFNLPPKLPAIRGDRDKIVLALHNLIGNALKYTPAEGQVTVNVEVDPRELVVEVTDTGIGIAEDEAELIFEKFYRSKDRRIASITGSGLGLALAREVVRLHGGDISVNSQLNKGSTFTLRVPTLAKAA